MPRRWCTHRGTWWSSSRATPAWTPALTTIPSQRTTRDVCPTPTPFAFFQRPASPPVINPARPGLSLSASGPADTTALRRAGSFYAVPDGAPPKDGWPVYIDFLAQPYANTSVFTADSEAQCGNGWLDPDGGFGPPSPPECLAFLGADTGCPRPKFQAFSNISKGEAACRTCLEELGNITAAANCSQYTSYSWCSIDPKEMEEPGAPNYKPFDTPLSSLASCFLANGSWNTGGGFMSNDGCTFNQFAGELWNARSHQLMLANGIAVVQLNPYTSDTWEWYTPDLPVGGGLDQPYFKALFEMMHNGSYANLGTVTHQYGHALMPIVLYYSHLACSFKRVGRSNRADFCQDKLGLLPLPGSRRHSLETLRRARFSETDRARSL